MAKMAETEKFDRKKYKNGKKERKFAQKRTVQGLVC